DALSIITSASLAMGRLDEAARAAEMLVARAPTLGSYALRGLVHVARGRDVEVAADFRRALAAEQPGEQSSSAWVRTLIGRFNMRRGRLVQAEELFTEALRILPQHPLTLIHLAELETRMGRYVEAERTYWKVLAVSPGASYPLVYDHVAMQGAARARALHGDREGAEVLWAKAEAVIRGHLNAFGHRRELARLILERGRPADALEALSLMEAEVLIRRDAETLDTLAWALSRAGRWKEARGVVDEAISTGIQDAALFHRAGVIEQALGRSSRAARWFRMAQETDPAFDPRLWALGVR
ncbi:MAG: tetratricopeptide repeat protein, partial [bacterium]